MMKPYYGYDLEQHPDHISISYKPGLYGGGAFGFICIASVIAAWWIAYALDLPFMSDSKDKNAAIKLFGFAAVLAITGYLVLNFFRFRKRYEILIFHDRLVANRRTYDLAHLSNVILKAPDMQVVNETRLYYGGGYGISGHVAATAAVGMNAVGEIKGVLAGWKNSEATRHGWTIWVTYGTREKCIAHKLNGGRATAIYKEICEVLFPQQRGH